MKKGAKEIKEVKEVEVMKEEIKEAEGMKAEVKEEGKSKWAAPDGRKWLYSRSQKSKSRRGFNLAIGLPRNPSRRPRNS